MKKAEKIEEIQKNPPIKFDIKKVLPSLEDKLEVSLNLFIIRFGKNKKG